MATPRVFVSSTCFDLVEARDAIASFCEGFGFDAVLSDRGDVFYHPDIHTHEACVYEVQNCHLLVLIIGGRFGGNYISNKSKSITNAEYAAARSKNIPVFCFVKQDVLDNHNLWQQNKKQEFSSQIIYPSIDKQEHAGDIFRFIDEVRHSSVNNGLFGFRLAREIEGLLRKQIAGMFFEFLNRRSMSKDIQTTNDAVNSLTLVANSIEQLVKSMYRGSDEKNAENAIQLIDHAARGEAFFVEMARLTEDRRFIPKKKIEHLIEKTHSSWKSALISTGYFQFGFDVEADESTAIDKSVGADKVLTYLGIKAITNNQGNIIDKDAETEARLNDSWSIFGKLPKETRREIILRYSYEPKANANLK